MQITGIEFWWKCGHGQDLDVVLVKANNEEEAIKKFEEAIRSTRDSDDGDFTNEIIPDPVNYEKLWASPLMSSNFVAVVT